MSLGGKRVLIKPLTRSTKAGRPYARPPEIESELEALMGASVDEQVGRASVVDKASPKFVRDECLVYLVREAGLSADSARYSELTAHLLRRCIRSIWRNLRALGVAADDLEDLYGDVVTAMMSAVLDARGAGEFYQIRFRRALRLQILKVHEGYTLRQERAQKQDSIHAPLTGGEDGEDEGTALEDLIGGPADLADDVERRLVIREALAAIRDQRHRRAFVLHHYDDWPIETKDPLDPSISRHFDVTPRTVNNWLRSAERDLAEWRAARSA